jgi:sorbitol/mannitol transport system substrate-binding protein
MWVDATVAASFVTNPKDSKVADAVAFAPAPCAVTCKNANWLWSWALAIPTSSKKREAAEKFVAWATSKDYIALVAAKEGWANVPPGTRASLYANAAYTSVAPFAPLTLAAINSANPGLDGNLKPKPYIGVQYAAIPEFQGIATAAGQQFAAALVGTTKPDQALANAQTLTEREMKKGGYIK